MDLNSDLTSNGTHCAKSTNDKSNHDSAVIWYRLAIMLSINRSIKQMISQWQKINTWMQLAYNKSHTAHQRIKCTLTATNSLENHKLS